MQQAACLFEIHESDNKDKTNAVTIKNKFFIL